MGQGCKDRKYGLGCCCSTWIFLHGGSMGWITFLSSTSFLFTLSSFYSLAAIRIVYMLRIVHYICWAPCLPCKSPSLAFNPSSQMNIWQVRQERNESKTWRILSLRFAHDDCVRWWSNVDVPSRCSLYSLKPSVLSHAFSLPDASDLPSLFFLFTCSYGHLRFIAVVQWRRLFPISPAWGSAAFSVSLGAHPLFSCVLPSSFPHTVCSGLRCSMDWAFLHTAWSNLRKIAYSDHRLCLRAPANHLELFLLRSPHPLAADACGSLCLLHEAFWSKCLCNSLWTHFHVFCRGHGPTHAGNHVVCMILLYPCWTHALLVSSSSICWRSCPLGAEMWSFSPSLSLSAAYFFLSIFDSDSARVSFVSSRFHGRFCPQSPVYWVALLQLRHCGATSMCSPVLSSLVNLLKGVAGSASSREPWILLNSLAGSALLSLFSSHHFLEATSFIVHG